MEHIGRERFEYIGENAREREAISRPSLTFMQDAMRRLIKNKVALVCSVVLVLMIIASVIAPMVCPFDFREQHYGHTNAPMMTVCDQQDSAGLGHMHIFGTDTLGRDMFSRVWMGGRISLTIAIVSAIIDFFLGVLYGGISGYFGGTTDIIMMRILEIINGIPYDDDSDSGNRNHHCGLLSCGMDSYGKACEGTGGSVEGTGIYIGSRGFGGESFQNYY